MVGIVNDKIIRCTGLGYASFWMISLHTTAPSLTPTNHHEHHSFPKLPLTWFRLYVTEILYFIVSWKFMLLSLPPPAVSLRRGRRRQ